jgi:hypothetical protein
MGAETNGRFSLESHLSSSARYSKPLSACSWHAAQERGVRAQLRDRGPRGPLHHFDLVGFAVVALPLDGLARVFEFGERGVVRAVEGLQFRRFAVPDGERERGDGERETGANG